MSEPDVAQCGCLRGETEPTRNGLLLASCMGCQARRLANSLMAMRARAGDSDDLDHAIRDIWKDDFDAGVLEVKRWMKRIKAANKAGP